MGTTLSPDDSKIDAGNSAAQGRPGSYKAIDAWRGFAAMWVVLHHATDFFIPTRPALASAPFYVFCLYGAWGVWMFFVISGYCIANAACAALPKADGLALYTKARFRRIFPAYWFSVVLYFLASAGAALLVAHHILRSSNLSNMDVTHQNWLYYLANATLAQKLLHQAPVCGVYWTLCYELLFYAIVGIGMALALRRRKPDVMLDAMHVTTIACMVLLIKAPSLSCYPIDLWAHFGLGVIVFDLLRFPKRLSPKVAMFATAGLIAFYAGMHHEFTNFIDARGGRSYIFSLAFSMLLLVLYRRDLALSRTKPVRAMAWVGQFTYSLYLTHMFTISCVWTIAQRTGLAARMPAAYVFTTLACAVFGGWVFYGKFERPFLKARPSLSPASAAPGSAAASLRAEVPDASR